MGFECGSSKKAVSLFSIKKLNTQHSHSKRTKVLHSFKIIALLEGISLLALFFIAMPLKYICKMEHATFYPGLAHGLLFVAYIYLAYAVKERQGWTNMQFAFVCLASMLPFGTFYMERKYLQSN